MNPAATTELLTAFERLIGRDPARRSLISDPAAPPRPGDLAAAARDLAEHAAHVAIVTGFSIPLPGGPVCETDGPSGAVLLASALESIGIRVRIVTDEPCFLVVAAAARLAGLDDACVVACPVEPWSAQGWFDRFWDDPWTGSLSHLVAIERVGPSHTVDSLLAQRRAGPAPIGAFETAVLVEERGRMHNMRGELIDAWTAPLHRLFEEFSERRPAARSIGIGDGGNEIGMGNLPWEDLFPRLPPGIGPRIVCRTPCDWTIVAGVSNWGGMALGLGAIAARNRLDGLRHWTAEWEQRLLERLVSEAGAVDGTTRDATPTVDGLPFATYIQPWQEMRRLAGWNT